MPQRRLVDNGDLGSLHTMSITTSFSQKFHGPWRWVCVCAVMALTACGGGSASDEVPSTLGNVVGAWKGNPGNQNSPVAALILSNGTYWAYYDNTAGTEAGFERGTARATGSSFWASAKAYPNRYTTSDVSISAEMSNGALNGSRTVGNTNPQSFALVRIPSADLVGQQVQVSDLDGVWNSVTLSGNSATLEASNGVFWGLGGNNSCNFEGTLIPQSNGYAFDVNLTFESNCGQSTVGATGIAMLFKISSTQKRLLMAVQNADRSKGWLFSATQP